MKKTFALFILLTAAVLSLSALPAIAHEERQVASYDMELGWRNEPAYTTLFNGPEIFVHKQGTGEAVEGLEDTLQLEVSYGGQSKLLKLRAVEGDAGHYTADLIPTQPGDYSFHVTGKIEDSAIDETFTSADGKFGSVDPVSDIQFP
jgi:hypothetical protein